MDYSLFAQDSDSDEEITFGFLSGVPSTSQSKTPIPASQASSVSVNPSAENLSQTTLSSQQSLLEELSQSNFGKSHPPEAAKAKAKNIGSIKTTPSKTPLSSMPLIYPSTFKTKNGIMLVQLEDAEMDLSGDVGAIGRLQTRKNKGVLLDIKGQQYSGEIVPSGSFLVVSIGSTEAKVEYTVSDFCQISRKRNMVDTLKGVVTEGVMDESYNDLKEEDAN